jgi:hypothetical protein
LAVRWRQSTSACAAASIARRDDFAVGGIGDRYRAAAIGIDPLAVDICLCFEQGLVGKLDGHCLVLREISKRDGSIPI